MKHLSKHLSVANVLSCIALFVALSGAAYAATTTLGKKAVKTQNLANGSVTKLKLRGGAVTNLKLRNGAVTGAKIANATIGSSQLANGAVRSEQLGGGVVTTAKLKNGAVTGEKLANGAITNSKLSNEAVTAGKLSKEAVTSDKLSAALLGQLVRNVSYINNANNAVSATSPQKIMAECPAGKQVTGGGAQVILGTAKEVAIIESMPFVAAGGRRTGWVAAAAKPEADTGDFTVAVTAICAEF